MFTSSNNHYFCFYDSGKRSSPWEWSEKCKLSSLALMGIGFFFFVAFVCVGDYGSALSA